jgi:hypothetical protein
MLVTEDFARFTRASIQGITHVQGLTLLTLVSLGVILTGHADILFGDTLTVAVLVTLALGTTVIAHVAKVALTHVGGHTVAVRFTPLLAVRLTLVAVIISDVALLALTLVGGRQVRTRLACVTRMVAIGAFILRWTLAE